MTLKQAAIVVEGLIGPKRFKFETSEWFNPRRTTLHIYTDYDKDACKLGFGDTWEECIEDLKRELEKKHDREPEKPSTSSNVQGLQSDR